MAIETIDGLPGGRVYLHTSLHAKFFIAEARSGSYAVLGSANLTEQGSVAREVGIAVTGRGWGEGLIRDLLLLAQSLRHDVNAYRWTEGVATNG